MNGFRNRQKRQLGQQPEQFPHLVVRLMSAVYSRYPIEFAQWNSSNHQPKALTLFESDPFDEFGRLTTDCRHRLIEIVRFEARASGLRMCVVLGSDETVYVESDGTTNESPDPPLGGLDIAPSNTTF